MGAKVQSTINAHRVDLRKLDFDSVGVASSRGGLTSVLRGLAGSSLEAMSPFHMRCNGRAISSQLEEHGMFLSTDLQ